MSAASERPEMIKDFLRMDTLAASVPDKQYGQRLCAAGCAAASEPVAHRQLPPVVSPLPHTERAFPLRQTGETQPTDCSKLVSVPPPRSAAFQRMLEQLRRFARDRTIPILLEGESGTGKTTIARELHHWSPRASYPFEHVVLSALSDTLAGDDLFGHVAGAFTDARHRRLGRFASANGGTLFLDEIGKSSAVVQRLLLHAIEYGEIRPGGAERDVRVDVRVVSATTVQLSALVEAGQFLPDLFARIGAFRVRVPALRERRADIPGLVDAYIDRYAAACGYAERPVVAEDLMIALSTAQWPYNVRQLHATVHRLMIEADGAATLMLQHCRDDLEYLRMGGAPSREITASDIEQALAATRNNITRAAKALGIDRTTLHRKLRALGAQMCSATPADHAGECGATPE